NDIEVSGRRLFWLFLSRHSPLATANNLGQTAQRTVYCLRIRKHFCHVGLQHDGVAVLYVTPRVLTTNTLRKIIFSQHLVVSLTCFVHKSVVLVCSRVVR